MLHGTLSEVGALTGSLSSENNLSGKLTSVHFDEL